MNITLKQDSERFVDELVRSGGYGSPSDVIEAAIARLRLDRLDEEDWQAIRESEAQISEGKVRDFNEVAAELRQKHLGR